MGDILAGVSSTASAPMSAQREVNGPNIKEIWRASGEVLAESATLSHEASREGEGRSTYPMRMGKVSANLSLTGAGGRDLARRHLEGRTSCRR